MTANLINYLLYGTTYIHFYFMQHLLEIVHLFYNMLFFPSSKHQKNVRLTFNKSNAYVAELSNS